MKQTSYERLVGWRYLFRRRKQPRILRIGLALTLLASVLAIAGYQLEASSGQAVSVFGSFTIGRALMMSGVALFSIALATLVFGALNRSMTLFTAFSTFMVAVGVAEVILVLAIMNGLHEDLGDKIVATKAHVVIAHATPGKFIENYQEVSARIETLDEVAGVTPLLDTEVMLSSLVNRVPAKMVGVNWRTLAATSAIPRQIAFGCIEALSERGKKCSPNIVKLSKEAGNSTENKITQAQLTQPTILADDPQKNSDPFAFPAPAHNSSVTLANVLIGSEMRKNLSIQLYDKITAISPFGELGPTGPIPKKEPLSVTGWFSSGMLEYDSHMIFAELNEVQNFLGLPDVVNQIQVKAHDIEASENMAAKVRSTLGPAFQVTDWRQRDQRLFSALQLEKIAMFIVLGINIILAAFSIVSTLVMTILERRKEVAIFTAMGASANSIFRIFLTQGTYIGLIGATLGAFIGGGLAFGLKELGLPLNQEVYYISAVPVSLNFTDLALIVAVALLVSVLSTIYPARLAARIDPIEGLSA